MCNKNEIMECIELNNETIKDAKKQISELKKHLAWCEEYALKFSDSMYGVGASFLDAIKYQEDRLAKAAELLAKRKKQLKLLEQLEAMENE